MSKKNNSVVKTTYGDQRMADNKASIIYTPRREDCEHGYRLATKARFSGIVSEYGKRARKVADVVNDPDTDLVYIIDEVE